MLGRFAVRWQPEVVLVGMLVVYVLAGLAVHGCGGGGGGRPAPQQQIRSRQVTQATSQAFGRVLSQAIGVQGGRGFVSRLRKLTRQATCPQVTTNWTDFTQPPPDPWVITLDYGNGCTDEDGNFGKGSITMSISNPQVDAEGDLVSGTIGFQFNNFTMEGETHSGTLTVEVINALTANVSLDLTYQAEGCTEHLLFDGTIAFAADETFFTISGNGTYTSSVLGDLQLSYVMTNLRFTDGCDFPVGGTMNVTYDNTTELWSFPGTCGVGSVSVNGGAPQNVVLEDIPTCG
ncbi:hypothetical protein HRbin17_01218 [bacterium HR17]|uniref:Uncharacterized protein n=1 Tax=Candidatus Fervidibacter japonicus TaxID=2035412 RepID=A0A2H5XC14_9BACT|nr:hypothetical protein HRbin17_01218 [bacterium HR17]